MNDVLLFLKSIFSVMCSVGLFLMFQVMSSALLQLSLLWKKKNLYLPHNGQNHNLQRQHFERKSKNKVFACTQIHLKMNCTTKEIERLYIWRDNLSIATTLNRQRWSVLSFTFTFSMLSSPSCAVLFLTPFLLRRTCKTPNTEAMMSVTPSQKLRGIIYPHSPVSFICWSSFFHKLNFAASAP